MDAGYGWMKSKSAKITRLKIQTLKVELGRPIDRSTFVESVNGWLSPTGAIELKNTADDQGQPLSGKQFIELNTDPLDHFQDSPGI